MREKASDKARNTSIKAVKTMWTQRVKLAACTSKNPEECEVYIVEGDSARRYGENGEK